MSNLSIRKPKPFHSFTANDVKVRHAACGNEPSILTDIYNEQNNIVIWQRNLSEALQHSAHVFLKTHSTFSATKTIASNAILTNVKKCLGSAATPELGEDIAELVDMFCCLFELTAVGLRLSVLNSAMCPRFHVDRIPCRLATTYHGVATQWLPHEAVNREKLGRGSNGKADHQTGLYKKECDIQQVHCGDVALLKGEIWEGNASAGLVHRSPALSKNERRLLLTLDFSS